MPVQMSFSAKTFFANVTFKLFLYNLLQSLVRSKVAVQMIFSAEKDTGSKRRNLKRRIANVEMFWAEIQLFEIICS